MLVMNQFILAPVIGMARGVLDRFDERARQRIDPQAFKPAIERARPQLRFAEPRGRTVDIRGPESLTRV